MGQKRGTFVTLDENFGLFAKCLRLWAFHERSALEDQDPERCSSREVLIRLADLLVVVCSKLPPARLLQRMQEFRESEIFQRVALAAIHSVAQMRLQIAVNYTENSVVSIMVEDMHLFFKCYEAPAPSPAGASPPEATFRLLKDGNLPAESWAY